VAVEILSKFDLNVYAFSLLAIILVIIFVKKDLYTFESRLFRAILIMTMFAVIIEILSWLWDGVDGSLAYSLNYIFNLSFSMIPTAITCLWAAYINYKIFGDIKRVRKRVYYLYPFMFIAVLSILNFFFPLTFSISESNIYHREPFLWLIYIANFSIYIYMLFILIKNRKAMNTNLLLEVFLIFVIPLIGATLQMIFYGILLIGAMLALEVVIVYIILETVSIKKDYLTNLNSRAKTDEYINRLIEKNKEFVVIMMDLDDYKELNDTHGHINGDKVLIGFAQILTTVFKEKSMIARYGGDEFIVVSEYISEFNVEYYKDRIYELLHTYSEEMPLLSTLKFSLGVSVYDGSKSLENMLVDSDNEMYRDKAKNKNMKRRKDDR
jgi:diguanylate cyclase (GGDEF)-like protein